MVMLGAMLAFPAASAQGVGTPNPSPGPAPAPPATTIVTDPVDFTGTGRVTVSGTKLSGSSVSVNAAGSALCSVRADTLTSWSCGSVALPNGAAVTLTAIEVAGDGSAVPNGTTTVDVLGPPTLDGPGSLTTPGLISGAGFPGAVVAASVDGSVDARCGAVAVQASGYWSCNLAQASGSYVVRAQQSSSAIGGGATSAYSNAQSIVIDRDAPASAVITAPAAETRVARLPATVTGTGEEGASVDLYIDNSPVCSTTVVGGAWACTISSIGGGAHSLQVIQRDAAGNYATPSPVSRVFFGPRAATVPSATPAPTPAPSATPAPTTPAPAESPTEQPVPPPGVDQPPGPPSSEGTIPLPGSSWGTPSGFGANLANATPLSASGWYTAPLLGLLFVVLVALPLRLLATALRGRIRMPRTALTGRNRDRHDVALRRGTLADRGAPRAPWITAVVPMLICAGLVVLAGGVSGEVRYLRLFLAVLLGLGILTVVGAVVSPSLMARSLGVSTTRRFLPLMLLAAVVTAVVSRVADLNPPLIAGVIIGAAFAAGTPARERAFVHLAQVGAVTALGVAGWMLHSALGSTTGFWPSLVSETATTLCLAGLGSALVLMIPLASLPGRSILEWSPPLWAGTVLVVASVVAAAVFGQPGAAADLTPWVIAATVFAALSVAVWAYTRFVEPQGPARA